MADFTMRQWYKGAVAASVPLLGLAGLSKERELVAMAVGLLFLGLGEWISHPIQTRIIEGAILSGEVRGPSLSASSSPASGWRCWRSAWCASRSRCSRASARPGQQERRQQPRRPDVKGVWTSPGAMQRLEVLSNHASVRF